MPSPSVDPFQRTHQELYAASGMSGYLPQDGVQSSTMDLRSRPAAPSSASMAHALGNALRESGESGFLGALSNVNDLLLRGGPVLGAAGYGLAGMGLGNLAGGAASMLGAAPGTARSWGNIAGVLGLLGGAYAGHTHEKYNEKQSSVSDDALARALMADASLDSMTRSQLMSRVLMLDEMSKQRLLSMIASLGTAATAAVIVRFLGGGLMSSATAGAAAGWVGGNAFDHFSSGNLSGLHSYQHTDNLGRPYIF